MAEENHGKVIDPDNVPETLCVGRTNVSPLGNMGVLTFTTVRLAPGPLIEHGKPDPQTIVRARIVMPFENIVALRDLLNRVIQENPPPGTKAN